MTPQRPPTPIYARRCPHCYRDVPEGLHAGCPVLLERAEEQERRERDRARLFGIERPCEEERP